MSPLWRQPARMRCWLGQSFLAPPTPRGQCGRSLKSPGSAVLAKVKFCGMTRPQDAALAAEIGASYVGVIFADGPRRVDPTTGSRILDAAGASVKRVGVFGTNDPEEISQAAAAARLDVVQLHADPSPSDVKAIRGKFRGEIWAAIRIEGTHIPGDAEELFDSADAIALDELDAAFDEAIRDPEFQKELERLLKEYVGRPSPLSTAPRLSAEVGCDVYLKREDLNHTGAHKINSALG